jgi:rhodanese-related sulfurtransferase
MVKQVSVTEAHALQQDGHVYVDVRSSEEFAAGHPAGAWNVPLLERDQRSGQIQPNPDFVRVMQASFQAGAKLLVGCQMGGRSQRAAQMLLTFGFAEVANVRGGFGGARDPMSGRVIDSGWEDSGLPIEEGQPADRSYQPLLSKADGGA